MNKTNETSKILTYSEFNRQKKIKAIKDKVKQVGGKGVNLTRATAFAVGKFIVRPRNLLDILLIIGIILSIGIVSNSQLPFILVHRQEIKAEITRMQEIQAREGDKGLSNYLEVKADKVEEPKKE